MKNEISSRMSSCSQDHDKWHQSQLEPWSVPSRSQWSEEALESIHWAYSRTLVATVHNLANPLSESLLHQVFDAFGLVEEIIIVPSKEKSQALVRFESFTSCFPAMLSIKGKFKDENGFKWDVCYLWKDLLDDVVTKNPMGKGMDANSFIHLKQMKFALDVMDGSLQTSDSLTSELAKGEHQLVDEMPVRVKCDENSLDKEVTLKSNVQMFDELSVMESDKSQVVYVETATCEMAYRIYEKDIKCYFLDSNYGCEMNVNILSYGHEKSVDASYLFDPGGYVVIMSHSARKSLLMVLYGFKIVALNFDYSIEINVIGYDDLGYRVCAGIGGKYSFETLVGLIQFSENELKSSKNEQQHMVVCSPTYAAKFGIESKGHMDDKLLEEAAFEAMYQHFAKEPDGDGSSAVQLYAKEASRLMVDVIKRGPTAQVEEKPEILSKVKVANGAVFDILGEIVTSKLVKKSLMLEEFQCSSTRVESERGIAIAEALGTCTHLKKINLRDNIFGVEAGLILSKVISLFSDLTEIYLSYLSLEDEGHIALVNALKKSAPSLEIMDMSGRGCHFDWQGTGDGKWSWSVMQMWTEMFVGMTAKQVRLVYIIAWVMLLKTAVTLGTWKAPYQMLKASKDSKSMLELDNSHLLFQNNEESKPLMNEVSTSAQLWDHKKFLRFKKGVCVVSKRILEDKDLLKGRGMSEPGIFKKDFIVLLFEVWTYFIIILEFRILLCNLSFNLSSILLISKCQPFL